MIKKKTTVPRNMTVAEFRKMMVTLIGIAIAVVAMMDWYVTQERANQATTTTTTVASSKEVSVLDSRPPIPEVEHQTESLEVYSSYTYTDEFGNPIALKGYVEQEIAFLDIRESLGVVELEVFYPCPSPIPGEIEGTYLRLFDSTSTYIDSLVDPDLREWVRVVLEDPEVEYVQLDFAIRIRYTSPQKGDPERLTDDMETSLFDTGWCLEEVLRLLEGGDTA